jgi:hypothetical protein
LRMLGTLSSLLSNSGRSILERRYCDFKAGEAVKLGVFRAETNEESSVAPPKRQGQWFESGLLDGNTREATCGRPTERSQIGQTAQ